MNVDGSLFDKADQPMLGAASEWIQNLLSGDLATSLCVIAIAILGMLLLGGRLQARRGMEVVLGCCLLLGAALMAAQLQLLVGGLNGRTKNAGNQLVITQSGASEPLSPVNYDPYAGASLRRDR